MFAPKKKPVSPILDNHIITFGALLIFSGFCILRYPKIVLKVWISVAIQSLNNSTIGNVWVCRKPDKSVIRIPIVDLTYCCAFFISGLCSCRNDCRRRQLCFGKGSFINAIVSWLENSKLRQIGVPTRGSFSRRFSEL